jgi:hypothetical protein
LTFFFNNVFCFSAVRMDDRRCRTTKKKEEEEKRKNER